MHTPVTKVGVVVCLMMMMMVDMPTISCIGEDCDTDKDCKIREHCTEKEYCEWCWGFGVLWGLVMNHWYTSDTCSQRPESFQPDCSAYTYGRSCEHQCLCVPRADHTRSCDDKTGKCSCQKGLRLDTNCRQACKRGDYGYDCASKCKCIFSDQEGHGTSRCDKETGECLCHRGYHGETCQHGSPEHNRHPHCIQKENCKCKLGFTGQNCDQGALNTEWLEWSSCDCERFRQRRERACSIDLSCPFDTERRSCGKDGQDGCPVKVKCDLREIHQRRFSYPFDVNQLVECKPGDSCQPGRPLPWHPFTGPGIRYAPAYCQPIPGPDNNCTCVGQGLLKLTKFTIVCDEVTGECPCVSSMYRPLRQFEGRRCTKIDGSLTQWGSWSSCTKTCGDGSHSRSRSCNPPRFGGANCSEPLTETQSCYTHPYPCPVNGNWSSWMQITECTVTCGGGSYRMIRDCDNPKPRYGGDDCYGSDTDQLVCNDYRC